MDFRIMLYEIVYRLTIWNQTQLTAKNKQVRRELKPVQWDNNIERNSKTIKHTLTIIVQNVCVTNKTEVRYLNKLTDKNTD